MKPNFTNHYARRNHNLRRIGFTSYGEYLRSDLWKSIRQKVFEKKGRACFCCNGHATQVHHTRYFQSVLLGKNIGYLKPICAHCHEEIEFDESRKRGVGGANARMHRIRKINNRKRAMRSVLTKKQRVEAAKKEYAKYARSLGASGGNIRSRAV